MSKNLLLYWLIVAFVPIAVFANNEAYFETSTMFDASILRESAVVRDMYLRASDTQDWVSLIDLLIDDVEDKKTKRWIVEHYCETLLWRREASTGNITDTSVFTLYRDEAWFRLDPRISLFMYTLCVNIDEAWAGNKFATYTYQKKDYHDEVFDEIVYSEPVDRSVEPVMFSEMIIPEPTDLNAIRWIPEQDRLDSDAAFSPCDPAWTMQWCDFATVLPRMFRTIMNDYINLKQAAVMGYTRSSSSESDELGDQDINLAIEQFSISHFWNPTNSTEPCNEAGYHYLSNEKSSGESTNHCYHPETYDLMKKNIESVDRLVRKTQIIDGSVVMKMNCESDWYLWDPKNTMHACAFSNFGNRPWVSDRQSLYNLMLNEYMRYSMFINYYTWRQTVEWVYQPLRRWSLLYSYQKAQQDAVSLAFERDIAKSAMYQSIRLLKNLATWYPVYIWLEAYKEDIVRYKWNLANLYTPFNQMYHTFQNVQNEK